MLPLGYAAIPLHIFYVFIIKISTTYHHYIVSGQNFNKTKDFFLVRQKEDDWSHLSPVNTTRVGRIGSPGFFLRQFFGGTIDSFRTRRQSLRRGPTPLQTFNYQSITVIARFRVVCISTLILEVQKKWAAVAAQR